jgi:hypothetical protein
MRIFVSLLGLDNASLPSQCGKYKRLFIFVGALSREAEVDYVYFQDPELPPIETAQLHEFAQGGSSNEAGYLYYASKKFSACWVNGLFQY